MQIDTNDIHAYYFGLVLPYKRTRPPLSLYANAIPAPSPLQIELEVQYCFMDFVVILLYVL